jgi:D-alanyl-D-alanine carboxypeptidase/D-alanyl-D-alanine-endopeptidase (penicillin-binding protein 4)
MLDNYFIGIILMLMRMREGIKQALLILLIFPVLGFSSIGKFQQQIAKSIESLLSDPQLSSINSGIAIYSLTEQEMLYEKNSHKLFVPASNMKLVTTSAGLHYLGKDFKFKTEFYHTGEIVNRRLEGDLIVKGYGDPGIAERFGQTSVGILEQWVDSLDRKGIRYILGNLTADASYFDTTAWGPGWSWDDLSYWYGAEVSALNLNDNCVDLEIRPAEKTGEPAEIIFLPNSDYLEVRNLATTGPEKSEFTFDYYRPSHSNRVTFFGNCPVGENNKWTDYVSVHDPPRFCLHVFREVLGRKGIKAEIADTLTIDSNPSLLFTWYSHPLSEIAAVVNKRSQNLYAECVMKALGKKIKGEGSFEAGAEALGEYLKMAGVAENQLKIHDGSGLSPLNLLSPAAIIQLLRFVHSQPYFKTFYESLAIPSEDKSMVSRMKEVKGKEKMRLKTGFISNVTCLSGYVTDKSGQMYAISLMFNNFTVPKESLWDIQDKICELIANYSEN